MTTATIYHNPRCSKSRETLKLLESRDLDVTIVKYLETPPEPETILKLCEWLGGKHPTEIIRTKEARFSELGLSVTDEKYPEDWAMMIADNPILLERPIVVIGNRAAIGRPPEQVLTLLDE